MKLNTTVLNIISSNDCSEIDHKDDMARSNAQMLLMSPCNLDQVIAKLTLANKDVVNDAIKRSKRAFESWAEYSFQKRIEILQKTLEIFDKRKDEFAKVITLENGKLLKESIKEVDAVLSDARFQLAYASKITNREEFKSDGVKIGEVRYCPLGVTLLITPWNYPLATVTRKLIPSLLWGNTVLCKPSLQTPISPSLFF